MKITIALPAYYRHPIGGYHVHYQYANLLAARGHAVTVLFPRAPTSRSQWRARLGTLAWAAKLRAKNRPLIVSFPLDPRVRVRLVPNLETPSLPDADALIATSWQTAEVLRHAADRKGRKLYVVYDYEYWMTADPETRARIEATFDDRFAIVATSAAVDAMIRGSGGVPVATVHCGLDLETFTTVVPSASRDRRIVGFPVRNEPFKGTADAVEAARILRERLGPDGIRVVAFGGRRPDDFGDIEWLQSPSQAALVDFYNRVAVFMLPSHFEGWGLTGVEAMACGAALVVTDNGGSRDYAVHGSNALVVPPKDPGALADAVASLVADDAMRCRLAESGRVAVRRFEWERAADALEALLPR